MKFTELAIAKAVEGGYKYRGDTLYYDEPMGQFYVSEDNGGFFVPSTSEFFLSPEFWNCLGVAEGWGKRCASCGDTDLRDDGHVICWCDQYVNQWHEQEGYLFFWHFFIDHLNADKSIESFFEGLLKK